MMNTQELLASAVRKLGPERAQQMLRAFSADWIHDYCGCALAHAHGNAVVKRISLDISDLPQGNLQRDAFENRITSWRMAEQSLGLSAEEVEAVSLAHCGWCGPDDTLHDRVGTLTLMRLLAAEAAKIAPRATVAL